MFKVSLAAFLLGACGGSGQAETEHSEHSDIAASTEATDPNSDIKPPQKVDPQWSSADAQVISRGPTPQERLVLNSLIVKTETVRGLRFKYPVPIAIQNRAAIELFVTEKLAEEDIATDKLVYTALGLIPPDMDVKQLMVDVMGEQIIGYYDPDDDRFVIRDDVMAKLGAGHATGESESVIVHELVHALQGQHLGLREQFEKDRDTDSALAYQSIVEGDATLAMIAFLASASNMPLRLMLGRLDAMVAMAKAAQGANEELDKAPPIVRVTLVAPYFEGLRFVGTHYRDGSWDSVNRTFEIRPPSMEQVLHVEKYGIDPPVKVKLEPVKTLIDAGYKLAKEDTLGELEMSVYLGLPGAKPNLGAAAGWGGDRLHVYQHPSDAHAAVVVWLTRWDSKKDADEAARAALPGGGRVAQRGKDVLFVRNADLGLAEQIRKEVSRASQVSFPSFVNP